ncbi:hypothetical protein G9C85_13900 [Halorubellus sp. JP-L1]|uniref:hypothetical protein n=1 Tax=Halorubellus sp. JP-L1 TaxID=2715753 RepID=UPI0014087169|nr:hypothetical protein [Halorubellus sp. JP-L1]NHN42715.1 hypothetical protein [Halorubellus sp. JP-L1]
MATRDDDDRSTTRKRLVDRYERVLKYVLVDANRYAFAAVLLVVASAPLLALELGNVVTVDQETTALYYLFSTLAGGNVTLITIVVSINQLVLSRELRSPGDLETEMDAAESFRADVESGLDRPVAPEAPADFLQLLVSQTREDVAAIADVYPSIDDEAVREDVADLVADLEPELDDTFDALQTSGTGVFSALTTILDADFSTHINHARWVVRANEGAMPGDLVEHVDSLEDELEQLDVARQYFKTVYITQELANVSRLMLSTGLLAVVVALALMVYAGYRVTLLPPAIHAVYIPVSVAVTLVPLALLITHVLRIATVARRTAAITPFLSPTK